MIDAIKDSFAWIGAWFAERFTPGLFALAESLTTVSGRVITAAIVGGLGLAWLLPGGRAGRLRRLSGIFFFLLASILLFSTGWMHAAPVASVVLWILTFVTIMAALAMISTTVPVYSAIWFAVTLLGVGGLFFVNGAQFLGVATVAVYAGAIVVTFLFVLMLAQPEGDAFYDRISWGRYPRYSASLAAMLVASLLTYASLESMTRQKPHEPGSVTLATEHVATFGGQLFARHVVEIQLAGTLLLVALVGAVLMVGQRATTRRGTAWGPMANGLTRALERTRE